MRALPEQCQKLIDAFEGCELEAYRDQGGRLTIGWGHTGDDVYEGLTITPDQADDLQRHDLRSAQAALESLVTVPLNDNQYSALVSFIFNVGQGNFAKSTMLRLLKSGNYDIAAQEFLKWDHVEGEVNAGLLRRRTAEKALFQQPMEA